MNILYIHQYFVTPNESGGTRSYWIAQKLLSCGHQVTMITSKKDLKQSVFKTQIDGIDVIYIKNKYNNKLNKIAKVNAFISFMIKASIKALRVKDVDIVYATSTPLTIGGIALFLKAVKHKHYIFEVRDLWPEFPIQIGAIRKKWLINLLRYFEHRIYVKSNCVVALSPGMQEGVVKSKIPENKVFVVPNMSKPDRFFPHVPSLECQQLFGINPKNFNIIHFGSMGIANGLMYILETAKLLKESGHDDIQFYFLGDGATCEGLKTYALTNSLLNVHFLGSHNMHDVSEIVNCCDLSITSFLNLPILKTNSPNKLFDSLSAGLPVVVNSAGWTKDLVEKERCGFYVDPESPQDFVTKILKYKDDKPLLNLWSRNSRALSLSKFDKDILCEQVVKIIENNR